MPIARGLVLLPFLAACGPPPPAAAPAAPPPRSWRADPQLRAWFPDYQAAWDGLAAAVEAGGPDCRGRAAALRRWLDQGAGPLQSLADRIVTRLDDLPDGSALYDQLAAAVEPQHRRLAALHDACIQDAAFAGAWAELAGGSNPCAPLLLVFAAP